MPSDRVIVVGAGMGGMSCALSLAQRGVGVTVVEAGEGPGGKMHPLAVAGRMVDSGPTVFTMRWVFEQMFEQAGASFAQRVPCTPLSVLARHAWRGAENGFDLLADRQAAVDAVARFSGPQEARRFTAFCAEAARLYRHLEGPYIRSERPTLASMIADLGPGGLVALTGLGPFSSLWRTLSRRFEDPRLRQLFGRYATYCGSSPWHAPATLMLIAQVEMDGVWSVDGGMATLAQAIETLARERGVEWRYGARVAEILMRNDRAAGVRLDDGQCLWAESVVFNGDVNALAQGRVAGARTAAPPVARKARSLSAMTWSVVAPTAGFDLVRHNVFFDADYRSEFEDIFGLGRLPRQPTVYVCAQDRTDDGASPACDPGGPERLLVLVNAPACGDSTLADPIHTRAINAREIEPCQTATFDLLRACGLQIDRPAGREVRTTPWDFERRFPATGGSLYGQATHGWMASFQRPSSRTTIPGLFLAGGSAHPGPGVPMAAMSGRLAAETVMAHLGSTRRSSRVVIAGGISTRSAMTGGTA